MVNAAVTIRAQHYEIMFPVTTPTSVWHDMMNMRDYTFADDFPSTIFAFTPGYSD